MKMDYSGREMNNELYGFTVYKPGGRGTIHLTIRTRVLGISAAACEVLGSEYVNVFLNEKKHRVMVKRADAEFQNVMRICVSGSSRVVGNAELTGILRKWFGDKAVIQGYKAGDGILIFYKDAVTFDEEGRRKREV